MKSVDFRQNNNILLSANIKSGALHSYHKPSFALESHKVDGPAVEFIDLDSDGQLPQSILDRRTVQADEPSLNVSLADLAKHAKRFGTEIVSPENTGGRLALESARGSLPPSPWTPGLVEAAPGTFSLDKLIAKEFPLGAPDNVSWAVDTTTQEFLLYTKK